MRLLLTFLMLLAFSAVTGAAQTVTLERFDKNADGLTIGKSAGTTLVGVTRDSSLIWSLYLGYDKKAEFTFSTGKTQTGTWDQKSRNLICFTGLVAERPSEEVCKLATALGRGMDWMSVKITGNRDNTTYYDKITPSETAGSSQMVFAFLGRQTVSRAAPSRDPRDWRGRVVVGRTLKDKEVFHMRFGTGNDVDFVFATGRRLQGTYRITGADVCMSFPTAPSADSCKRPVWDGKRLLWQTPSTGQAISEIVYVTPVVRLPAAKPAPAPKPFPVVEAPYDKPVTTFARSDTYAVAKVSANGELIAALDKDRKLRLFSGWTQKLLLPVRNGGRPGFTDTAIAADDMAMDAKGRVIAFRQGDRVVLLRPMSEEEKLDRAAEGAPLDDADMYIETLPFDGTDPAPKLADFALSPAGAYLVSVAGGGWVEMRDARTGALRWIASTGVADAQRVAFSPDGTQIAIGGKTGIVKLLSARTGDPITQHVWQTSEELAKRPANGSVNALRFAPDGKSLVAGSFGGVLTRFDITDAGLVPKYTKTHAGVHDVDFVQVLGDVALAVASRGKPVQVYRYASGQIRMQLGPTSAGANQVNNLGDGVLMTAAAEGGLQVWALTQQAKTAFFARITRSKDAVAMIEQDFIQPMNTGHAAFQAAQKRVEALFDAGDCAAFTAEATPRKIRDIETARDTTCAQQQERRAQQDVDKAVRAAFNDGNCGFIAANFATTTDAYRANLTTASAVALCENFAGLRRLAASVDDMVLAGRCEAIAARRDEMITLSQAVDAFGADDIPDSERQRIEARVDARIADVTRKCEIYALFEVAPAMEMFMGGVRFEAQGKPDIARELYAKLLQRHPNDPIAMKTAERILELVDKSVGTTPAKPQDFGPIPPSADRMGGFFDPGLPPLK